MVAAAGGDGPVLRSAPVVDIADLVDAAYSAVWRAGLGGEELTLNVCRCVVGDWSAGESALL